MEQCVGQEAERAVARFIRDGHQDILSQWSRAARALGPARPLPSEALLDHMPHMLDRIIEMVEDMAEGRQPRQPEAESVQHAIDRLQEGFDLGDVVTEYALLRESIMRVVAKQPEVPLEVAILLNRAIDAATRTTMIRFTNANQRMLRALDRISIAALGNESLDSLLEKLLAVLMEASPSVDCGAIMLREGDRLYVRAAVGLITDRDRAFSLAIGEGFAGTIAKTGKPLFLRDAANDALVVSDYLRRAGIRALYGMPLHDDDVLGVAHIGSRTAFEFTAEERLLFGAMCGRATALIAEAKLKERVNQQARTLAAILSAVPDAISVMGRDGRYLYVSDAAGRLVGVRPEDAIDKTWRELGLPPAVMEPILAKAERVFAGGSIEHGEATLQTSAGVRHFDYVVAPIGDGTIESVVVAGRDMTERKHQEEERELYLGIIGHDLRNPLQAIKLSAHTMLRSSTDLPPAVVKALNRINGTVDRMDRLIRHLLDFARTSHGGILPIDRQPSDLAALARRVVEEFEITRPDREIRVSAQGQVACDCDIDRLAQLLQNLVGNALDHGATDRPVTITVGGDESECTIEVHNWGAAGPIPPGILPRIFDPFRKGGEGSAEGLGLGLYISKQIVLAHGGSIEVTSTANEGTVFRVRLPRTSKPI